LPCGLARGRARQSRRRRAWFAVSPSPWGIRVLSCCRIAQLILRKESAARRRIPSGSAAFGRDVPPYRQHQRLRSARFSTIKRRYCQAFAVQRPNFVGATPNRLASLRTTKCSSNFRPPINASHPPHRILHPSSTHLRFTPDGGLRRDGAELRRAVLGPVTISTLTINGRGLSWLVGSTALSSGSIRLTSDSS